VDVRIIAATNRNLETLVKDGMFRNDLYYRLKVMVVEMPPLRDRPEDILLLSDLFVEENNREHAKNIKGFTEEAKRLMTQYHWPGNVRELKNVIERAMILTGQEHIAQDKLPFEMKEKEESTPPPQEMYGFGNQDGFSLEQVEKVHIARILKRFEGNKSKASKLLGISRATLREKIKRYQIEDH
jgi:transcriptional regulator with PAS, ATPase and Fis domain